jgi:hypothetical protein
MTSSRLLSISAASLALGLALSVSPVHAQDENPAYATQTSEGAVTLEVTPKWTSDGLVLTLTANTHSVDLASIDLGEAVRLYLSDDTATEPVRAGSLDGHHAEAEVVFELELPEAPTAFRIEIRGVADVDVRVLTWPLEGEGGPA